MAGAAIVRAGEQDAARWDAYVDAAPGATFFHRFGWRRVIDRAYGYETVGLMAVKDGRVAGVLPLTDVRSPLLGRALVSTAFTVGGGAVADNPGVFAALVAAAEEEGRARRARYVELRGGPAPEGWAVKDTLYAGFEKPLLADEEEALKAIPRRRRAELRKALCAAAAGTLAADFDGDVDIFHRLYAQAMRDHGTPVFPRRFAKALMEAFAGDAEILVVRAGGEPALALLAFCFRDRVMPYYFGARPDARERRAFDYAIWLQMRRGAARGARLFDFGRSRTGSGSYAYKTHWGFAPAPLAYHYRLLAARSTPNVSPANPTFALASAAWRRLPLAVANAAGPMLARHLA